MKLSRILAAAGLTCTEEQEITGLTCDSGQVKPGFLFAALEGARRDGRTWIPSAVEAGAAAVLCRGAVTAPVPAIDCRDPRRALGLMAAEFFGRPGEALTLAAVTGTKGKTTTACMLREILLAEGRKVGMIGTLGSFVGHRPISAAANTTPEPVELHRLLAEMRAAGCTHGVMEVSSQAMKLRRVEGLSFAAGVFLNLSPDHIGPGEHGSYEEYRACKGALFSRCRTAVVNKAHPEWPAIASMIPRGVEVVPFGPWQWRAGPGLTSFLRLPGREEYLIPMPGRFNGENAVAAIRTAEVLGVSDGSIRSGLGRTAVPGRCRVFPAPAPYSVVVDYAHNGASFSALFSALREGCPGRIIAVFGAGGDRPAMRRADLGRAAAEGADFAVLTADNPRGERVEDICASIAAAMGGLPHALVPRREEAIRFALDMAAAGDTVVLLGKGHETYMEEGGRRRPFSEWAVLEDYFGVSAAID